MSTTQMYLEGIVMLLFDRVQLHISKTLVVLIVKNQMYRKGHLKVCECIIDVIYVVTDTISNLEVATSPEEISSTIVSEDSTSVDSATNMSSATTTSSATSPVTTTSFTERTATTTTITTALDKTEITTALASDETESATTISQNYSTDIEGKCDF